jgi:hypothetical protein
VFFLTALSILGARKVISARPIKKVVLIPYWIQETLSRHSCALGDATNFDQLSQFVNTNDLIGFFALQRYIMELAGFEVHGNALAIKWGETATREGAQTLLTQTIIPFANDEEYLEDVASRLFTSDSRFERSPHHVEPFNMYDITHDVAGVVIHPGFFTEEPGANGYRAALIEAILKVLYAYNAFHEVASTPLFKRYLGLLADKQLTV